MSEFRWIKTSLFLILVLQFTAAATGQLVLYVTVRDGDEVTLPCNSVMYGSKNCDSTKWVFDVARRPAAVVLVKDGQIDEEAKAKSDRLSVSEKCSLVIKDVTDGDVGRYICRQYILVQRQGPDALVLLHVVTRGDKAFRNSPSGEKTGDDTITATTESTPTEDDTKAANTTTTSAIGDASPKLQSTGSDSTCWWRFIFVSVGLVALIIIVVVVNMWSRIKEKKTQMDQIAVRYDGEDDTVTYDNIRPPDGV